MRLTLLSPHQDEVRQEYALAFPDWFQERTRQKVAAARQALQVWLRNPSSPQDQAVRQAFQDLLRDWKAEDVPEVSAAHDRWLQQPTPEQGENLLRALDQWAEQPHPVEIVWQDIGGGTSQIVRFVGARFQSHPEGIGIDLLFGGGTDIYLRFADQGVLEKVDLTPELLQRIPPDL
ncbi:MAG: hypothetical protein JO112_22270, partial [Planctomycetes bacterium]|nr:hypothetical protein [Planctomycetota bacterium]